jgi:enoyl-CoA hydratase/carnithine racemase
VPLVEVSQAGHVATLTLNRPEARNALSIELCDAIVEGLEAIDRSEARAVVVGGAGKVFCAGADFAAVSGPGASEFLPAFERMLEAVARFRLPTIAKIHGAALGGGLQLATVCDFRIAASDASLGVPSTSLGIVVNFENVQRLVHLAGVAVAKEILMAGRRFKGPRAERAGLVTMSVPTEELTTEVEDFSEDVAALAPLSVQGAKRSIQFVVDYQSTAPDSHIESLVVEAYSSEDLQEGLKAMAEKREPKFEGR